MHVLSGKATLYSMKDIADVVKPEQQVYSIATKIHVKETIYIHVDALKRGSSC